MGGVEERQLNEMHGDLKSFVSFYFCGVGNFEPDIYCSFVFIAHAYLQHLLLYLDNSILCALLFILRCSCKQQEYLNCVLWRWKLVYSYECYLGRQQLTSLLLDPIDGLPLIPDDIQDRLQQITIEHKVNCCYWKTTL